MKKFFAVLLALTMLAALLSGCMCEVADTDLRAVFFDAAAAT